MCFKKDEVAGRGGMKYKGGSNIQLVILKKVNLGLQKRLELQDGSRRRLTDILLLNTDEDNAMVVREGFCLLLEEDRKGEMRFNIFLYNAGKHLNVTSKEG